MMRILLVGADGQVGTELRRLKLPFIDLVPLDRHDLDLTSEQSIRQCIRAVRPAIIINAAEFDAVDSAESHWEECFAINATAPAILAEESLLHDSLLIQYSTDYVFDGKKTEAYVEEDSTTPLNIYGASKIAAEQAIRSSRARVLVLRTSWVYSLHGDNFLLKLLRLAQEKPELRIVNDQVGAPTSAREIARSTALLIHEFARLGKTGFPAGTYHMTASGWTSWYGFASAILKILPGKKDPAKLAPILSEEYAATAERPKSSVLSNQKFLRAFGFQLSDWRDQLVEVLADLSAWQPGELSLAQENIKPGKHILQ